MVMNFNVAAGILAMSLLVGSATCQIPTQTLLDNICGGDLNPSSSAKRFGLIEDRTIVSLKKGEVIQTFFP